eukprot:TRINITY_DN27978_c0_g1_i1.p1 TRINITY_DN27978_c0_g1~~TRINITY_DN27978_c0_g1_i1.p1  ORF type:complete len:579 (+),score=162.40 TRINITY_DN27978_c0_g1_i1:67-1803(+)
MMLRDPPAQILQVRADLAKAKHSRYRSARSRSVPTTLGGTMTPRQGGGSGGCVYKREHTLVSTPKTTGRSAATMPVSPPTAPRSSVRSRSAPKRGAATQAHGHGASTSVNSVRRDFVRPHPRTPVARSPSAGLRFTPTKAELSKIRNDLASDKSCFTAAYPVPPSPVQFANTAGPASPLIQTPRREVSAPRAGSEDARPVPSRYTVASPGSLPPTQTATILAPTVVVPPPAVAPGCGMVSSAVLEAVQDELAAVRRELEAEKQHSEALRAQARDAAGTWDAKVKEHKAESARLDAALRKAEATSAHAIADREELRKRMSVEIADLKRELDERKKDIRSLQTALTHHQEQQQRQQLLRHEAEVAGRTKQLPSIVHGKAAPPTGGAVPATPPLQQRPPSHGYPLPRRRDGEAELQDLVDGQSPLDTARRHRKKKIRWSADVVYKEPSPNPRQESPSPEDSSDEDPANDVDDDLLRDLHDMFDEYDVDGTGCLPRTRVEDAFREMESTFGLDERPIAFPMHAHYAPDAMIDFRTFVQIMSVLPSRLARETELCLADMEEEVEDITTVGSTADDSSSNSGSF